MGCSFIGRNAPGATRASLTAAVASSAVAPEPWRPRHAPAKPPTGPRPPSWSPRRGRVDVDQVEATRLGARRAGSLGQLGALPPGRCRSRRPLLLHSSPVEPPTAACGGELRRGRARTPWRTRRPPPQRNRPLITAVEPAALEGDLVGLSLLPRQRSQDLNVPAAVTARGLEKSSRVARESQHRGSPCDGAAGVVVNGHGPARARSGRGAGYLTQGAAPADRRGQQVRVRGCPATGWRTRW